MLASSLSLNPCQLTKADGITDCSSYLNAEFSFIFILKLLCTYSPTYYDIESFDIPLLLE